MRNMEGHELSFYRSSSMPGDEENDCEGQAKRDRENHSPQHQGNVSPSSKLKFYPRGGIILSSTDHPLGGKHACAVLEDCARLVASIRTPQYGNRYDDATVSYARERWTENAACTQKPNCTNLADILCLLVAGAIVTNDLDEDDRELTYAVSFAFCVGF